MSVEAYLGLDNSRFRTGLAEAKMLLAEFKSSAEKDLDGPSLGEKIAEGLGNSESLGEAAGNTVEVLIEKVSKLAGKYGELAKIAGYAFLAFKIGNEIRKALEEAASQATKVFDGFQELAKVDITSATNEGLRELADSAEQVVKDAGETGWLGKMLFGKGIKATGAAARGILDDAKARLSAREKEIAERPTRESQVRVVGASAVTASEKEEARRMEVRLSFEERITDAHNENNKALEEQLALERDALLLSIDREESARKNAEITEKGAKAFAEMQKLEEARASRIAAERQDELDRAEPEKKIQIIKSQIASQDMLAHVAADPVEREKAATKVIELRTALRDVEKAKADQIQREREVAEKKQERIEEAREKNALALMNVEEKRVYLKEKFDREQDPLKKQELAGQLIGMAGSQGAIPVDALRQIGLSAGNANYGADRLVKVEDYLKDIREYVKKTSEKEAGTEGDAQFGGGS